MDKQVSFKLLPKQQEFFDATEKEVLTSGAWGSSKSTALCFAVLKEAMIQNAQILLCRKTYTSLRRTTLQTLLYGTNPIIPKGSYKYNQVSQTIKLNGYGSTIYLAGLDSMEKIRSMNLSLVAIDEASELVEEEWVELMGRLRCESGSRRIIAATNPASPSHFLYQRFYVNKSPNRRVINSTTFENSFLPKDYLDSLKELPEKLYNRFVMGEWLELDKSIYSMWDRQKHIKTRSMGEFQRYYLGCDWGWTNPTAIGLFGVDGDNNLHLIEESKESKILIGEVVEKCQKYYKLQPIVVVDPSAPALIAEFERAGFTVKKANNSVDEGITRMQNLLGKDKLTVDPSCVEFIKEVENYIYDDKGKPVKINDHMMDCCRYICQEVDTTMSSAPVLLGFDDFDGEDEDEHNWQTIGAIR